MCALAYSGLSADLFDHSKRPFPTQDHYRSISWVRCDVAILDVCRRNDLSGDPLRWYDVQLEPLAWRHRAIRRPGREGDRIPRRWKFNVARDMQHASCP